MVGRECCPDTLICCPEPCDECLEPGTLSGGSISAEPACLGQTISFTLSAVADSGGQQRVECALEDIPPATPEYTWWITRPVGGPVTGTGPVATVEATDPGPYSCTFTATAPRDCPPAPRTIGPETLTIIEVDLDVDGDDDGHITRAGDPTEDTPFLAETPSTDC